MPREMLQEQRKEANVAAGTAIRVDAIDKLAARLRQLLEV